MVLTFIDEIIFSMARKIFKNQLYSISPNSAKFKYIDRQFFVMILFEQNEKKLRMPNLFRVWGGGVIYIY